MQQVSTRRQRQLPIEGHGNLVVDFQSGQDFVRIELFNVAYVPSLGHHLLSIPFCVGDGHTFVFDTKGVTVHLKYGQELIVPPVGKMYFGYGHRLVSETEQACAVIALGSCLPPMRISTRTTVPPHTRTLVY